MRMDREHRFRFSPPEWTLMAFRVQLPTTWEQIRATFQRYFSDKPELLNASRIYGLRRAVFEQLFRIIPFSKIIRGCLITNIRMKAIKIEADPRKSFQAFGVLPLLEEVGSFWAPG